MINFVSNTSAYKLLLEYYTLWLTKYIFELLQNKNTFENHPSAIKSHFELKSFIFKNKVNRKKAKFLIIIIIRSRQSYMCWNKESLTHSRYFNFLIDVVHFFIYSTSICHGIEVKNLGSNVTESETSGK